MKNEHKKGHPVLGVVLGIMGMLAGALGFLTGIIGGGIALLIGVTALILGIMAGKRGAVAIIAGLLAIVVAVGGTMGGIGMVEQLREKAEKSGQAPLIAKYAGEKPYLGVLGLAMSIPEGEGDLQAMVNEINALNNLNVATETKTLTEVDMVNGSLV